MISDATKKKNPWMLHVSKVKAMKNNKGKPYSEILKIAKQSYKKKLKK